MSGSFKKKRNASFCRLYLAPIATPEQEEKIFKYVVFHNYKSVVDLLKDYYIGELNKDGKSESLYVYNDNTFTWDRIRELDKKVEVLKKKKMLAENEKEFKRLAAKYGMHMLVIYTIIRVVTINLI